MWRALCGALLTAALTVQSATVAAEKLRPFRLKTLDGATITLADVLGKATLVVFFFPTCPYCNAAFPEIQRIHDGYKDQGLSTVWINVVPGERRLIANWQAKHGYRVPILLGGRTVQDDYALTATPTHYLLNSEGEIVARQTGFSPGDEKRLESEVRKVLAS